jgi:DNA-directed RNA polymerase specialized sigma subunit
METNLQSAEEAYNRWAQDQTPQNMATIIESLNPTLNAEIQRYPGPKPLLKTQAKKLAVKAVRTYDPMAKAKLRSWVVTQLQPLNRYGRSVSSPVRASELAVRQAAEIDSVRRRLVDELGDNPTDEQLADEVGISVRRIRKLRDTVKPVLSEEAFRSEEGGEVFEPAVQETGTPPELDTATQMVYHSLEDRDRKIFEWKTGYNGTPVIDNMSIAKRLGVSPAFVSQRSAAITQQIMDTMNRV